MDDFLPVLVRLFFGFLLFGFGAYSVFGDTLLKGTKLEEDIRTGNTFVHGFTRWWEHKAKDVYGERKLHLWNLCVGTTLMIVGVLILFGFIQLEAIV